MRAQSIRPICKGPEVSRVQSPSSSKIFRLTGKRCLLGFCKHQDGSLGLIDVCRMWISSFSFKPQGKKHHLPFGRSDRGWIHLIYPFIFKYLGSYLRAENLCFFFRLSSKVHHEVRHPDFFRPSIFEPARLPANVSSIPCELLQPGGKITLSWSWKVTQRPCPILAQLLCHWVVLR